jgi:hypothetical protein
MRSAGHSLFATARRFAISMISLSVLGLAGAYVARFVPI